MSEARNMFWKSRLRASGIHLCISLGVAVLAALLVFLVWYPYPYREISGGRDLFFILVSVDVVLGPLITLTVFNPTKPRRELVRDLSIVGLIQLSALGYGLWTVFEARPVHLAFEIDRFRVVHAIDVEPEMLAKAPEGLRSLPLFGQTPVAVRPFRDAREKYEATVAALQGVQMGFRPDLWQPYADARMRVLLAASPLARLRQRFPDKTGLIDEAIAQTGKAEASLVSMPMVGRDKFWTVLLDSSTAEVVGFIPLDSF
ncbi:MAG: TfpX/TfpZ family type IV pilin accessory protein [Burkholderiales bacterium]|jgi:hypothetical protein